MRISFLWFGIDGRYGKWADGLYKAMKVIEKKHEVKYFEPTDLESIKTFNPDWILFWEAPCTGNGKDKEMYWNVCKLPFKKALLFAGGPIEPMWVKDFDHIFIESQIDMDTCERFSLPHSRAFGVNDDIFKPEKQPKIWDGMHQCTCASWKRTWLMTEALGRESMICGRYQHHDPKCFDDARNHRALVLPEQSAESVCSLINASYCVVNTSGFWGGGQRATLESIACGIPVVVMKDSPKNCEFIAESGYGIICEPNPKAIKEAVIKVKSIEWDRNKSLEYMKKWSGENYAKSILDIIEK